MENIQLDFSPGNIVALNICLAIIMFGVALDLRWSDFRQLAENPKATLVGLLAQFITMPALTFLLILLWKPHPAMALGMILVAACPGGNVSTFLCQYAKGNVALSITLSAISTIVAIFATPLNFAFWSSLLPDAQTDQQIVIDIWDMFQSILIVLLLPLLAGMAFSRLLPAVTEKIKKPIANLSLVIFAAFVIMAFSKNADVFIAYFDKVMLLVLVHNGIALVSGYALGYIFRLAEPDRRSVALESGLQNSGLGLVLIFNFFGGMGGMALIAAWWGVWHIVSGFSLALWWRSRSKSTASQN